MKIHEIHDTSNSHVIGLLEQGLSKVTDLDIIKNYHPDYRGTNGNIFNILENGRYRLGIGKYFVIESDSKYIASAGWNDYHLSDVPTALLLTRMYTSPEYRGKYHIGNNILPLAISETKHYDQVWMTCNEYNKEIYNWFVRIQQGRKPTLFDDWPEIYKKFKPIGKKTIYYTDQFVVELSKY